MAIYLPDGAAISSDVVTFIGLRLLAAVFAVPGRAIGRLEKCKRAIECIHCKTSVVTHQHCLDQLPLVVEVVVLVVQLNK